MLRLALLFLIIALIAGTMGMVPAEIVAANIAWTLFVLFLIFALVAVAFGRHSRPID